MAEIPISFNLSLPKPGGGASAVASIYSADRAQEADLVRSALSYKLGMEKIKEDYFNDLLISRDKGLAREQEQLKMLLTERERETKRQQSMHQFNLDQMNDSLRNALNISNDANVKHYEDMIKSYVGSMHPYFQNAFRPWLKQNAMGSVEYRDYNFRKNNPYPRTPDSTFAEDPYGHGQAYFRQDDWRRRRSANNTKTAIEPAPSFIKLIDKNSEEPIYLLRDSEGRPYYMSAQDINMNDMIKRWGGTEADLLNFHKEGGVLKGSIYESFNPLTNRVERNQLEIRPFAESGKEYSVKTLPPQGQTSFDARPAVDRFAGYPDHVKKMLSDIQTKFGPYMQLDAEKLETLQDPSASTAVLKEIRRMLDKGLEFDEIGKRLSGRFAPDLNLRLIEPAQFDKYTWYNPLDFFDPKHIKGRIEAKDPSRFKIDRRTGKTLREEYKGYDYPVGEMDWNLAKFWEGSVYSQGPDFDMVMFRGVLTPFQRNDGTVVHYFYDNTDGADVVRSAQGLKLGTHGYVTEYLLRGGTFAIGTE